MPNHGFYNFSPTFYYDWYKHLGNYEVVSGTVWLKDTKTGSESQAFVPIVDRFNLPTENASNLFLVNKKEETKEGSSFPIQTKYKSMIKEEGENKNEN
jgi:hypothetical protein